MDMYTATEEAYKNGYAQGYEDGKIEAIKYGSWKAVNKDSRGYASSYKCSVCGCISTQHCFLKYCEFDFCPVCGANNNEWVRMLAEE